MNMQVNTDSFQAMNKGFNSVFQANSLSVGLVVPIENYADSAVPTMENQLQHIKRAEELGFSSVWLRDVPFNVPSFGDAGQVFDPWVYLGLLAGNTSKIALGVASIVLPLRHPAHVAKAAASVDVLSGGRLILGVASGDRADEYPALNSTYDNRGERFRESIEYIKSMWASYPVVNNQYGHANGSIDMLPKPIDGRIPLLITGSSQQSPAWIAENGDGWMTYPRGFDQQAQVIDDWNKRVRKSGRLAKPIMQPLYIDLVDDAEAEPEPIHLGFRAGSKYLNTYLKHLEGIGVNHVALNVRFNRVEITQTLETLAKEVLINFTTTV